MEGRVARCVARLWRDRPVARPLCSAARQRWHVARLQRHRAGGKAGCLCLAIRSDSLRQLRLELSELGRRLRRGRGRRPLLDGAHAGLAPVQSGRAALAGTALCCTARGGVWLGRQNDMEFLRITFDQDIRRAHIPRFFRACTFRDPLHAGRLQAARVPHKRVLPQRQRTAGPSGLHRTGADREARRAGQKKGALPRGLPAY